MGEPAVHLAVQRLHLTSQAAHDGHAYNPSRPIARIDHDLDLAIQRDVGKDILMVVCNDIMPSETSLPLDVLLFINDLPHPL